MHAIESKITHPRVDDRLLFNQLTVLYHESGRLQLIGGAAAVFPSSLNLQWISVRSSLSVIWGENLRCEASLSAQQAIEQLGGGGTAAKLVRTYQVDSVEWAVVLDLRAFFRHEKHEPLETQSVFAALPPIIRLAELETRETVYIKSEARNGATGLPRQLIGLNK